MSGYHISPTTKKAEKCPAKIRCRISSSNEHYETLEKAQAVAKEKAELAEKVNEQITKQRKIFNALSPQERDYKLRDQRQGKNTVYHQLIKEGVSDEQIVAALGVEVETREAGLALVSAQGDENADPIVGLNYGGDYRWEEENGMAKISKALLDGSYNIPLELEETRDGLSILIIHNPESYRPTDVGQKLTERNRERAISWYKNPYQSIPFDEQSKLYNMNASELKEALKGKVKPMPTKRDALVQAYKEEFLYDKSFVPPTVGEFHSGRELILVSRSPEMKLMMKKVKEAADAKSLRVGFSANPFSRGSVFYDERDLSRGHKMYEAAEVKAKKDSLKRVEKIAKKFIEAPSNGIARRKFKLTTNAKPGVEPGTEKYFLDYDLPSGVTTPNGKKSVSGWFTKEQLEKIADGDYSRA